MTEVEYEVPFTATVHYKDGGHKAIVKGRFEGEVFIDLEYKVEKAD